MYKLLLILFLVPLSITASDRSGKYTKSKTIKKEFSVDQNATMEVKNKYGDIDIVTWNENRIVMEITITTNGNDEKKTVARLDQIDVKFDASRSHVSAKTTIEKNSKNWSIWGKKNNVSIDIKYTIKMPVTNAVDLTMDYGGISLDKIEGAATIDCDYGRLNIGELLNNNNDINVDYTNNSKIEFMKNGTIDSDYSTLHFERSGTVQLNSDYSHLSFGSVESLDYDCDYGSLKVQSAGAIDGNSDYMHATIENLNGNGIFDADYGSISIGALGNSFGSLTIHTSYTHNSIVSGNTPFNVDLTMSNTGFKSVDGFTFNKEIKNSSKKYYAGYHGQSNSSNKITVESKYGSLKFK